VELLVALLLYANLTLYFLAVLAAAAMIYLVLRHPTAIAYVAIGWLVLEKGIGQHFSTSADNLISNGGDGLLVVALFWTVVMNLVRRRTPVFTLSFVGIPLVAFTILSIVSTLMNGVPLRIAGLGILSTLHAVIIFLVIINIGISAPDVYRFVYVAVGVMSVAALIGVMQAIPHSPAWVLGGSRLATASGIMRVTGPFDHPNSMGDYLAMTVPLGITLLAMGKVGRRMHVVLLVGTSLMLVALLLTFAREGWIAIPVGLLFLGLTVDRKLAHVFVTHVLPPLVVMAVVFAPFSSRLAEIGKGNLRLQLLQLSLPLIESHLLFGVGPGRFGGHVALITHTPLYAQYHLTDLFYGTGNQIDMYWTHLLAESGILGTAAFLAMIIGCFVVGRKAYRAAQAPRRRAVLLGLLFVIPVTVFVSLVSPTLEAAPGATLFWAYMGMLTVLALSPESLPNAGEARV
jgi:O-antigen ligase